MPYEKLCSTSGRNQFMAILCLVLCMRSDQLIGTTLSALLFIRLSIRFGSVSLTGASGSQINLRPEFYIAFFHILHASNLYSLVAQLTCGNILLCCFYLITARCCLACCVPICSTFHTCFKTVGCFLFCFVCFFEMGVRK